MNTKMATSVPGATLENLQHDTHTTHTSNVLSGFVRHIVPRPKQHENVASLTNGYNAFERLNSLENLCVKYAGAIR